MRSNLLILLLLITSFCFSKSRVKDEIYLNPRIAASGYLAYNYDYLTKSIPPPSGYYPFYITTYARHGSRFLIDSSQYQIPYNILKKADELCMLTKRGKEIFLMLDSLYRMSKNHLGELTELGVKQHQEIAKRMFNNYPQIFSNNKKIIARSTIIIRCIKSMMTECLELQKNNSSLNFDFDASKSDMYYMNNMNPAFKDFINNDSLNQLISSIEKNNFSTISLTNVLFKDSLYVRENVNDESLFNTLFELAMNMQSHDIFPEFISIFTKDECYYMWQKGNISSYVSMGPSKISQGKMPFIESELLLNFLNSADIALSDTSICANLRFGHESCLLPLISLMEINNYGKCYESIDEINENWVNYKAFPMAGNVQWVFYKNIENDILVKVLLNEQDAILPIYSDIQPYYDWNDMKTYYYNKIITF